jgi:hypothetical protein
MCFELLNAYWADVSQKVGFTYFSQRAVATLLSHKISMMQLHTVSVQGLSEFILNPITSFQQSPP